MVKKFSATLLAFLFVLNAFAHPIKMTTAKLSYDKKANELILLINFFEDDFAAHLEKIYHKRGVDFLSSSDVEKKMVATYVNRRFVVKLNKKQSPLLLQSMKHIEDNVMQARFSVAVPKGQELRLMEFTNALLFDAFHEQVNIMHLEFEGADLDRPVLQFIPSDSYKLVNVKM